ncbi:MAG: dihydropteroate synthase, partial [Hyphomicrobiales bacterium]|nr:dihydropteroate synthase [Hyphomicrobiales bacterium]
RDPDMAGVVATHDVPIIVTHNRETVDPTLDIIADIEAFFSRSLEIAWSAGIGRNRIVLDPGIGFGKSPQQSLVAIAGIPRLRDFALPLLIGLSRKRFINAVSPSPPQDRLPGSLAGAVLSVLEGAAIVRVHDVAETVQALRVAAAIRAAR